MNPHAIRNVYWNNLVLFMDAMTLQISQVCVRHLFFVAATLLQIYITLLRLVALGFIDLHTCKKRLFLEYDICKHPMSIIYLKCLTVSNFQGLAMETVRFRFDGVPLNPEDTAADVCIHMLLK